MAGRIVIHKNMFPYKFHCLDKEENRLIDFLYKGELSEFVRVGPEKYILTTDFIKEAPHIYNLPLCTEDIIVTGYPRSGTTWTQELVWLIVNNLDYKTAKSIPVFARYAFLEYTMFFNEKVQEKLRIINKGKKENLAIIKRYGTPGAQLVINKPSPCFIKTHLGLSLLPPDTLDTANVVYIARDPRDVAVSFYHHNKLFKYINFKGDFKSYWTLFINDLIPLCPYFENIKQAWKERHHPNMLFLFYEDLQKDLPKAIRRVATFFGKEYNQTQIEELHAYLHIDNLKTNASVNRDEMRKLGMLACEDSFIRKGQVGGWRDYFDEEMSHQAERWIADNLKDTDFRFPHMENKYNNISRGRPRVEQEAPDSKGRQMPNVKAPFRGAGLSGINKITTGDK